MQDPLGTHPKESLLQERIEKGRMVDFRGPFQSLQFNVASRD